MTKKNYFTISDIAKEFKVKKTQIRSFEKNGLITAGKDKLGRRIYNPFDRARLELIFHFEHIDYSPDQISGLIGILDVNLNKLEQFRNSLEYGEKKLDELEKRSKKIKFPDRISAINEMNIMRNYIKKLKTIEPLKSVTETTLEQKHIRMLPVFVGLSIIILFISGYFFYHGGTILNLAKKKPSMAEASPLYRYPVPTDDTVDQQNGDPLPSVTPDSPVPIQEGDSFTEKSKDAIIDVEGSEVLPAQKDLNVLKKNASLKESGPVKKWQEANLTHQTGVTPFLKAGPSVTRIKPAVPSKQGDRQLESKKLLDKTISSISEDRTENEDIAIKREPLDSNDTQLNPVADASDEKKQTHDKVSSVSQVKKTKLNTDQNNLKAQNYMVSLHYTSDDDRELLEELAMVLRTKNFDIIGIKKVEYQNRDIRYFHDEDKPGALFLQKIANRLFTRLMNIEDINIKIKNLSNEYPNARKGALELWVNL